MNVIRFALDTTVVANSVESLCACEQAKGQHRMQACCTDAGAVGALCG